MVDDQQEFELLIGSEDEQLISSIESELNKNVQTVRGKKTRELGILTIIGIIAGTLKIVNEIVRLKRQFANQPEKPGMQLRFNGETLDVWKASEDEIRAFVAKGQAEVEPNQK